MTKLIIILFFIPISLHAHYNVMDFGAKSDTNSLSTSAINTAIQTCAREGGGRVYIPSGKFKSGTIILKSNVELYLEYGCVLYGSREIKDYPQKQTNYPSLSDKTGFRALIYGEGEENIAITGGGTIDGQGSYHVFNPENDIRPKNLVLISCKGVNISNIKMLNSGSWNQHYLDCEDLFIHKINVYNHSNKNNDGLDIDGCRRVVVSDCIIDSDDDGIVLKSTGAFGCEDIAITNCIVSSFCNAIKCGTESTGGFKNITISNCTVKPSKSKEELFYGTRIGITGISLEITDGGVMDGVNVNNVVIDGTDCPIYVRLANRGRKHTPNASEPKQGIMRNIQISNIIAYNTGNYSSSITGVPGGVIDNISLSNIRIINKGGLKKGDFIETYDKVKEDIKGYPQPTIWGNLPSYGFFIRHVKDIILSDIYLDSNSPEIRFPIIGVDIDRFYVRNLQVEYGRVEPKIQQIGVKNFIIKD